MSLWGYCNPAYFCSRLTTGFLTSWICGLPSGAPGMFLTSFCGVSRESVGTYKLLKYTLVQSTLRFPAWHIFLHVSHMALRTHLVVALEALPVRIPLAAALVANLLNPVCQHTRV